MKSFLFHLKTSTNIYEKCNLFSKISVIFMNDEINITRWEESFSTKVINILEKAS